MCGAIVYGLSDAADSSAGVGSRVPDYPQLMTRLSHCGLAATSLASALSFPGLMGSPERSMVYAVSRPLV